MNLWPPRSILHYQILIYNCYFYFVMLICYQLYLSLASNLVTSKTRGLTTLLPCWGHVVYARCVGVAHFVSSGDSYYIYKLSSLTKGNTCYCSTSPLRLGNPNNSYGRKHSCCPRYTRQKMWSGHIVSNSHCAWVIEVISGGHYFDPIAFV